MGTLDQRPVQQSSQCVISLMRQWENLVVSQTWKFRFDVNSFPCLPCRDPIRERLPKENVRRCARYLTRKKSYFHIISAVAKPYLAVGAKEVRGKNSCINDKALEGRSSITHSIRGEILCGDVESSAISFRRSVLFIKCFIIQNRAEFKRDLSAVSFRTQSNPFILWFIH